MTEAQKGSMRLVKDPEINQIETELNSIKMNAE